MFILPAIDLKDGKAVRLTKGLMESAKIYSDKPWEFAKKFEDEGAKWLHVVDLDGAFAKEPKNFEVVEKIRKYCGLKIEIGGGIRNEASIKRYVDMGIDRVILGSVALSNPDLVKEVAKKYPIAVGIDAIDGYVAVEGWAQKSKILAIDLAKMFSDAGVEAIICTDVGRDGTLCGVNVEFTVSIANASKIDTIASGGVKDLSDIEALAKTKNVFGAIVGKAYYEGALKIEDAIKIAAKFNEN